MITVMDSVKETRNGSDTCLDSQLWQACAGSMIQIPPLNSKVFYFPQGHAEHADGNVDFRTHQIQPLILCRVSVIKFMADPGSDEVYAKIRLVPLRNFELNFDDDDELGSFRGNDGVDESDKPVSFAKTLTQSDANNGGGFSVPRYCAETIFPPLDYSAEPPIQNIQVKDVHGKDWKFRHIYRGTPRRHLLTTGWSSFVSEKDLSAGDSVVFLRAENGDLRIGVRRVKRGIGGGFEYGFRSQHWGNSDGELKGKVIGESVVEAAVCATNGEAFEVVYYPRGRSPEFCVRASSFRAAMQVQWCAGMRFKMPFETEDPSRISWFMGTIASVQVADPIRWPNSPWRLLQVAWDEPELLQNVKRVSPWLVELVSNMSAIHLSHFAPPSKRMRLPQHSDLSLFGQIPMPSFFGNPLSSSLSRNIPAGVQGARHAQLGIPSPNIHYNTLQSSLFPMGFQHPDRSPSLPRIPGGNFMGCTKKNSNISSLLSMGNPSQPLKENSTTKPPHFVLFGQLILTEEQISRSSSGDTIGNSSSEGNVEKDNYHSDGSGSASHQNGPPENSSDEFDLETGHCKVFMESENVGRTLDLSLLESYEELHEKLANMFGIGSSDMLTNVLYRNALGSIKHTGDESFSEFLKNAKRLTILMDSGSDNIGI